MVNPPIKQTAQERPETGGELLQFIMALKKTDVKRRVIGEEKTV